MAFALRHGLGLNDPALVEWFLADAAPRLKAALADPTLLHGRAGRENLRTPEEWKAYSQNFGHSSPMTTFNSYGPVAPHRQAEILNALVLAKPDRTAPPIQSVRLDDDQVRLILNQLRQDQGDVPAA